MKPPQDNKSLDELARKYATNKEYPNSVWLNQGFKAGYRARDEEVSNAKAEGYMEAVRELRDKHDEESGPQYFADWLEKRGREKGVLK